MTAEQIRAETKSTDLRPGRRLLVVGLAVATGILVSIGRLPVESVLIATLAVLVGFAKADTG